jgi:hypothetical protein
VAGAGRTIAKPSFPRLAATSVFLSFNPRVPNTLPFWAEDRMGTDLNVSSDAPPRSAWRERGPPRYDGAVPALALVKVIPSGFVAGQRPPAVFRLDSGLSFGIEVTRGVRDRGEAGCLGGSYYIQSSASTMAGWDVLDLLAAPDGRPMSSPFFRSH